MTTVPSVTFKTRVRNDAIEGDNPFEWKDLTTDDLKASGSLFSLCRVPSRPHAQPATCRVTKNFLKSLRSKVSIRLFACRSTTPSSCTNGENLRVQIMCSYCLTGPVNSPKRWECWSTSRTLVLDFAVGDIPCWLRTVRL